ncbi:hypothetical protein BM221_005835 [Beauveria bassiana]|uniref:Uncharacterized protein n=1 Tax=Beauveria bassiana TaxID=176275 RepID=A0A2N6NK78_BEABA|nr:hypothetical protein BM221_005835 [Beauveria bassiana]
MDADWLDDGLTGLQGILPGAGALQGKTRQWDDAGDVRGLSATIRVWVKSHDTVDGEWENDGCRTAEENGLHGMGLDKDQTDIGE